MRSVVGWLSLLALALLSWRQTQVWTSDRALWTHEMAVNPSLVRPALNLVASALREGDCLAAGVAHQQATMVSPVSVAEQHAVCVVLAAQRVWLEAFCPITPLPDWAPCW